MTQNCKSCRKDLDESHFVETYKTCNECRTKKKTRSTKHTLKTCQDFAEAKGGKCLSTEYKNITSKMKWQCSKGHEWEIGFNNVKNNGNWCPQCGGSKQLTIKDCQSAAKAKGGKCMSTEYKNNISKLKWQCSEGHEWESCLGNIRNNGTWCPCCSGNTKLTLTDCQDVALSKGGKCLSTTYTNCDTKMKWKCHKGHIWHTTLYVIKNMGCWCLECGGRKTLTIEECKSFAKAKGGKCLSTEYKNAYQKLLWQCSEGHEWNANFHHIKHGNRWCPDCSKFKTEAVCRTIVERYLSKNFPNTRPKFLKGLELDGYNKELRIAFEYNGKQHYEYVPFFHKNGPVNLETQKSRDRKKFRLCHKYGVKLVIIPYQYSYLNPEELEDFIVNELWKIV